MTDLSENQSPVLFSVLIANYNNGRYLETCLQSIFSQTYPHWEVVIVDDASTDESLTLYEKYAGDARIKIFRNNVNRGCGAAKRACVQHAAGDVCGFLDADDALLPTTLEVMVRKHRENPGYSMVYSTHYICDENLIPQKAADYVGQIPPDRRSMTLLNPVISHFATFKRSNYLLTEGISEMYTKAVDKDLYYKMEDTGPALYVNEPLYLYRHHAGSISLNDQKRVAHYYELTAKVLALLRLKGDARHFRNLPHKESQLVGGVLGVAYFEWRKKNFGRSLNLILKITLFSPLAFIRFFLEKGMDLWKNFGPWSR